MKTYLGALDIGTQTTRLVAGEYADGNLAVEACLETQTTGVKKGVIRDLDEVSKSVRNLGREMKERHHIELYDVSVSFSAGAIKDIARTGRKSLLAGHPIERADVEDAEQNAGSLDSPDAAERVLQRFQQRYEVNGQPVNNPIGMSGTDLVANVLELTAPSAAVEAVYTAVQRAGMRVADLTFSALAAAMAVLDRKARESGTIVIDFGAGTVDVIAFCNGVVAAAVTLGVGGFHLTNDLALAFNVSQAQAEEMKLERGAAMIQPDIAHERYAVSTKFATANRSFSVHAIQTVLTERVDETLNIIRNELVERGVLPHVHQVVLTGGTAGLPLITERVSAIFSLPCLLGVPAGFTQLPKEMTNAPYRQATVLGLLKWRQMLLSQAAPSQSLFARFKSFLRG